MPTVVVSSSSALLSALKSATANTRIELTSGTYTINTRSQDFSGAVVTAAAGADVAFSKVTLNNVSHLTFERVAFEGPDGQGKPFVIAGSTDIAIRNATIDGADRNGYGSGHGLWISNNRGFTLENSQVTDFQTGLWIGGNTDVTIRGNSISNISLDGMIVGRVHDAVFANNTIDLNVPAGTKHTDGMQFYNSVTNDPLSDVLISGNVIHTHNTASHGIYMANGLADQGGDASTFFRDITIVNNTVVGGQVSGIAVGQTIGLDVSGNTIRQDPGFYSTREVSTPVIRVHSASTDVSITDNATHKLPQASGANWQPGKTVPADWIISGNTIIPLGDQPSPPPPPPPPPPPAAPARDPEHYRFDKSGPTDVVTGLDFGKGDTIELYGFKGGTFYGQKGGNFLLVTVNGALLDSVEDLRELDAASPKVSIHDGGNDTLVIDIDQPGGMHSIELLAFAHVYFA